MSAYYFLLSSLPSLQWAKKPFFTWKTFLDTAYDHLSHEEYQIVSGLSLEPSIKTHHPVMEKWAAWEKELRIYLATLRSGKLNFNPNLEKANGQFYFLMNKVQSILASQDPLETEKSLFHLRWEYLDELEQGEFFTFTNVIIYGLRLLVLQNMEKWTLERGQDFFHRDYQKIIDQEQIGQ